MPKPPDAYHELTEKTEPGGSGAGPGKRQAYDRKKGFFRESESGHFPGPCSAPPDAPEKVFSKHKAGGEGCRGGGAAAGLSWLPTGRTGKGFFKA